MSFAAIKKVDVLSVIVNNTVLDAAGSPHIVEDDVLDTSGNPHTIFGATVALTPLTIVEFELYDNRNFEL